MSHGDIEIALRWGATSDQLISKGYTLNRVSSHSLRAGRAMAMKLSSASNSTNMGWAMVIIKVPHINLFANRSINGRSGMENVYSLHVSKCRVINSVRQLNEVGRKY